MHASCEKETLRNQRKVWNRESGSDLGKSIDGKEDLSLQSSKKNPYVTKVSITKVFVPSTPKPRMQL